MTLLQSIVLGIIQGITEFLPISSSGHLVLVPNLLGWEIPSQDAFVFDVLVQVATLVAVFTYFWHDILQITGGFLGGIATKKPFGTHQARLGWLLILATIPAGLAGIFFNATFEKAFSNPKSTALFLLITAGLLILAEQLGKRTSSLETITWKDALLMGIFQILALFPGVSRSGATITGGMLRNLDRPTAARFSFLMSVPIMLAAGVNATYKFIELPHSISSFPIFLAGCVVAAIVGYLSIRWLLHFLTQRPLYIFAIYCVIFSLVNLIVIAL